MFRSITSDAFLQRYAVYFSGSMAVAVLNYAFHPIMGRILTPADFGEIQAMLALITQSAIILGAFSVVAINVTANINDISERNAVLFELQKFALLIVSVAIIAFLFFFNDLQTFFNFSSSFVLVAAVVMLPLSTIATFRDAYLQGTGKFSFLSLAQLLSASARLFFSATLAAVGFGMMGAIAGIVIANALLLLCLVYYTYKFFPFQVTSSIHVLERGSIKRELQYGVLVFFATALVTVYYTSDVLIVKRFFTLEEAGLYSGISAIGKILFFVIGPVFAILISSIKIQNSFIQNSHALAKAMTIGVVIGSICLCTFYLFHDIVVKLMLGNVYLPFSHFLPKVSLVMFLAALVNILILYFLALRRFFLVVVSTLGFASMGLVLFSTPSNIDAIINHLIVSLSVILLALVIVYGKDYFNYRSRV